MLGRILVRQNNTEDIATIRNYQDQTILKTIPRNLSQPFTAQAPRLSRALIDTSNATSRVTGYLNLLAKIGPFNQPDVLSDRYRVASTLGLAGLANGLYTPLAPSTSPPPPSPQTPASPPHTPATSSTSATTG